MSTLRPFDSPTLDSESWQLQDANSNFSSTSSVSESKKHVEPVAVIGLGLRFPGTVEDAESFWQMLLEGRCAASKVPKDRFNVDSLYHPDGGRRDAINVHDGHFVEGDIAEFDAPFFSISASEAAAMDLQHRNLLEVAYRAFEDAGLPLSKIHGSRTGVYTGSFDGDYKLSATNDLDNVPAHSATGTSMTMLAARLSWFYNLTGPCFNIDTACSSSMVALDSACQGLRLGECDMALVGGANTLSGVNSWISLTNMGFLSPDGRSFSFDHRANGYSRGEGFAVVLLKRLSTALRDGDNIRGIIRSSGVNQDGRTPAITQPSATAQSDLMKAVYEKAGLDYDNTHFLEAHGTGTALGDPTECQAINSVFSASQRRSLYIGAVKSNIGHLEGASGLASLIKTILVLEHGVIPPNANFEKINPRIEAANYNFTFLKNPAPWPLSGLRRASVNSFGYGGTNAHVIIEDAAHYLELNGLRGAHQTRLVPPAEDEVVGARPGNCPAVSNNESSPISGRETLFVLSSFDEAGSVRQSEDFANLDRLQTYASLPQNNELYDIAYTLSERRTAFNWRSFAVCSSMTGLKDLPHTLSRPRLAANIPKLAVMFTGQGAQYAQMAKDLIRMPIFTDTLYYAQKVLSQNGCSWLLVEELAKDASNTRVDEPEISQPLCTAIQIGVVRLYRHIGLPVDYVLGHSSGEIACAYSTGALNLESAIKVSFFRGQAAMKLYKEKDQQAGMLAVGCGPETISPHLVKFPSLSIACFNSPNSMTISGPIAQIESLRALLTILKIFNRVLRTGVAYHSVQMLRVADWYKDQLDNASLCGDDEIEYGPTMISSVSGHEVLGKDLQTSRYWVDNLVQPVQFSQALQATINISKTSVDKRNPMTLLEIGPHSALKGPVADVIKSLDFNFEHRYYSTLERGSRGVDTFFASVGNLFCDGHQLSVLKCNSLFDRKAQVPRLITGIPGYKFNHKSRFWTESRAETLRRNRHHAKHELLGIRVGDWNPLEPRWRLIVRLREMPWITGHQVNGQIVYPAMGYLSMAIEGLRQLNEERSDIEGFVIKEASVSHALVFENDQAETELQLSFRNAKYSQRDIVGWDFVCHSLSKNSQWQEHCRGQLELALRDGQQETSLDSSFAQYTSQKVSRQFEQAKSCATAGIEKDTAYEFLKEKAGFLYQGAFRQLEQIAYNANYEATARLYPARWLQGSEDTRLQPHLAHPAVTDSVCQLMLIALSRGATTEIPTPVPTRLRNVWISASGVGSTLEEKAIIGYAKTSWKGFRGVLSSISAFSENSGRPVFSIESLESSSLTSSNVDSRLEQPRSLSFRVEWKPDVETTSRTLIQQQYRKDDPRKLRWCHLCEHLELMVHKNPSMNILQVGPMCQEMTDNFWELFAADGNLRLHKLTTTDTLLAARIQIESLWPGEQHRLDLRDIDIEQKLGDQDIDLASFDLIIWSPAYLSNFEPNQALTNLAKLLTSSGKLIVFRQAPQSLEISDNEVPAKKEGQEMTSGGICHFDEKRWNGMLLDNGFTEAEFVSPSGQGQNSDHSGILISSAKTSLLDLHLMAESIGQVFLICDPKSQIQGLIAQELQTIFSPKPCIVITLQDAIESLYSRHGCFVSLLEVQSQFLHGMDEGTFLHLKKLLNTVSTLLWVGQIAEEMESASTYSLIDGLARTIRHERRDINLTTLRLELNQTNVSSIADKISRVFDLSHRTPQEREFEYREKGGMLHVGRLRQDKVMDESISARHDAASIIRHMKVAECPPSKLSIASLGQLQTLRFIEDPEFREPLAANMVEIEVQSTDLSFADVLTALGRTSHSELGAVCAGTVTHVGSQVHDFRPGDQVVAFYLGVMKTYARCPSEAVTLVPSGLSLHAATGLLVPYLTAHIALFDFARLSEGETILIHSAAGATGQAAIQIAKHIGAEVFATVSSQEKADFLTAEYGIPSRNIFSSRSTKFAEAVRSMTGGDGVDVALNSLADEKLLATWEVIAPCGRFVEIGKKNIYENSGLPMAFFARNISFHCLDLRDPVLYRRAKVPQRQKEILEMIQKGSISPIKPTVAVPVSEMVQAFRELAGGKSIGKFVLEIRPDYTIPTSLDFKPAYEFAADATYLISGGLGGLGMSIANWMIKRGARNFILLSRYGPRTQKHLDFLQSNQSHANIQTPACDIMDEEALRQVLATVSSKMPPIRGCIQSHMLIQDRIFENMDFESWNMSIGPKVKGSLNLHRCLPAEMDFCVFLSSIAGVLGSPSQANYAAGNTFQDALAAYRISQGRKTISLNLGWMEGEGYVAENERVLQNMRSSQHLSAMTQEELFGALDTFCDPRITVDNLEQAHVAFGVEMPASVRAKDGQEPDFMQVPLWRLLRNQTRSDNGNAGEMNGQEVDPAAELVAASSSGEALAVVTTLLTQKLSRTIGMELQQIDPSKALLEFGVDSLLAVELQNWCASVLKSDVSVFDFLTQEPLSSVAALVASKSQHCGKLFATTE